MFATHTMFAFIAIYIQSAHGLVPNWYDIICVGARFDIDGTYWYAAHITNCDKYVQCHVNDNMKVVGKERQCSFSTFWDNVLKTCVGVKEANCRWDPCKTLKDDTLFKGIGNCRGYWKCFAEQSEAQCCKIGEVFDGKVNSCIEDYRQSCSDVCFDDVVPEPGKCDKRATQDAHEFEQQLSNGGWVKMKCSPGTSYVQGMCDCAEFSETPVAPPALCKPEIYLPFDVDTHDKSGNGYSVLNHNVQVNNGFAIFDGTSQLLIPRFNNIGHLASIRINVKYVSNHLAGGTRPIITNHCGIMGHSFSIKEDSKNVHCTCKTTGAPKGVGIFLQQESYVELPSYKDVTCMVDSGILYSSLGKTSSNVKALGTLQAVKCGLQIGFSFALPEFVGKIDEVTVYLCNPLLKHGASHG